MARDHRATYDSLLRMTVANGCTAAEAESARSKAEAIARREGFPWPPLGKPGPQQRQSAGSRSDARSAWSSVFGFDVDPDEMAKMLDALRRAARAAAEREMAKRAAERAKAGPKGSPEREAHKRAEHAQAYGAEAYPAGGGYNGFADPFKTTDFRTVKACAEAYLGRGWTVAQTLRAVKWRFPGRDTKEASIRWYASKMRKRKEI